VKTVGDISGLPESVAVVHVAPLLPSPPPSDLTSHPLLFQILYTTPKEFLPPLTPSRTLRGRAPYPAPKAVMEAACKKKRTNLNAFFKRYTPNAKVMIPATALNASPELLTIVTPKKILLVLSKSAPLSPTRVGSLAVEILQQLFHLRYLEQEDLDHLVTAEAEHRRKSPTPI
jgi:hypothetical protein